MRSKFIDTLIIGGGQAGLAMSHDGRYGRHPEHGEFRARDAWIRRDGRWQKLASQLTPIHK